MRLIEADKRATRKNLTEEEQALFWMCHKMERPLLLLVIVMAIPAAAALLKFGVCLWGLLV